jgi:hypothetical protein
MIFVDTVSTRHILFVKTVCASCVKLAMQYLAFCLLTQPNDYVLWRGFESVSTNNDLVVVEHLINALLVKS